MFALSVAREYMYFHTVLYLEREKNNNNNGLLLTVSPPSGSLPVKNYNIKK